MARLRMKMVLAAASEAAVWMVEGRVWMEREGALPFLPCLPFLLSPSHRDGIYHPEVAVGHPQRQGQRVAVGLCVGWQAVGERKQKKTLPFPCFSPSPTHTPTHQHISRAPLRIHAQHFAGGGVPPRRRGGHREGPRLAWRAAAAAVVVVVVVG